MIPEKIDAAISGRVECLVDFLRMLAKRVAAPVAFGGILRERDILHHQGRRKAGL